MANTRAESSQQIAKWSHSAQLGSLLQVGLALSFVWAAPILLFGTDISSTRGYFLGVLVAPVSFVPLAALNLWWSSRKRAKAPGLDASLVSVILVLPVLASLGYLLARVTHHRPLGAVTFALLALVLGIGVSALNAGFAGEPRLSPHFTSARIAGTEPRQPWFPAVVRVMLFLVLLGLVALVAKSGDPRLTSIVLQLVWGAALLGLLHLAPFLALVAKLPVLPAVPLAGVYLALLCIGAVLGKDQWEIIWQKTPLVMISFAPWFS